MVELMPSGVQTLLHASMIDHYLVNPMKMGYNMGQEMEVKYLGREERTGRLVVSRKALLDPSKGTDVSGRNGCGHHRVMRGGASGICIPMV